MSTYRLTRRGEWVRDAALMGAWGVLAGIGLALMALPLALYFGGAR